MISLSNNISGMPRQASAAAYRQLLAENHVEEILQDVKQNGNRDRKKSLPVWIPQAAYFKNGTRKAKDAVPSGLFFLDIDEKGLTEQLWQKVCEEKLIEAFGLVYFAESAGGGTHIWGRRTAGSTIEGDIQRLAQRLGVSYDSHVTDLSRCCFMVSEPYVKLLDESIFAEPAWQEVEATEAEQRAEQQGNEIKATESDTIPDTFGDLPYQDIVNLLLVRMGCAGGPVDGERNNTLYALARYMRYICEFDVQRMFQLLPHWGLTDQEVTQTLKSAVNSARSNEMPYLLKEVLQQAARTQQKDDEQQDDDNAADCHMPQHLPGMLQQLADHAPQEFKEAVVMAALPMLGTLATGLRARYRDGKLNSPSFIVSIWAPQATGKSFVDDEMNLLMAPIIEQDEVEWQKEMKYSLARKNGEEVENPKAQIRIIEPTIGVSAFLERAIYANGKHLFTYAPEVETVNKNNKGGAWTQKGDMFRLAYDNKMWGQHRVSKDSFSGKVQLFYNLLVCGTPRQSRAFFHDAENGLVSRVCFLELPDMMGAPMPVFQSWSQAEEQEVKRLCSELMKADGEIALPRVNEALAAWDEGKRQEVLRTLSHALDTFRRRAALNGFRAAMIAYKLCGNQETDEVVEFACWVAECCLHYQMKLYGSSIEAINNIQETTITRNVEYLKMLDSEFTTADLVNLRIANGQSDNVRMILSRWRKEGLIANVTKGLYRKMKV